MGRHRLKKLIYSSQDWSVMQTALLLASKQFEPPNYPNADRLARRVMTLFDGGLRDAANARVGGCASGEIDCSDWVVP